MRRVSMLLLLAVVLTICSAVAPAHPLSGAITIQDTPTALVPGGVGGFALAAPKLFWYNSIPACPPAGPALAATYTQSISRIATVGGPTRTIYTHGEECNASEIYSNVVADANYLYWLAPTGLVRLPTTANPGDAYQNVNTLVKPNGEIANGGDRIFYLNPNGAFTQFGYVLKSTNQRVNLQTVGEGANRLSFDGVYIYYILDGILYRLDPGINVSVPLASGVTSYYAEGRRISTCTTNGCATTQNVYIAMGTTIKIYDNVTNQLGNVIYTSSNASFSIYNIVSTPRDLFLFERQPQPCGSPPCAPDTIDVLFRLGRSGQTPTPIHTFSAGAGPDMDALTTDGTFLYWQQNNTVQQLATIASAVPDLRITGMEITQGIQNLSNSVPLIQNRRTFVRVYVASADAAVPNVTAQLSSSLGTLQPVNPTGTTITVRRTPDRNDINQSFLFELPWNWTNASSLQLSATLNPNKYPAEQNYANNVLTSGTLSFKPSPNLSAQFFLLNFSLGGSTSYKPRISDDVLNTYSWLLRTYPIGGAIGQNFKPRLWEVDGGTQLGAWVNRSSAACDVVAKEQGDRSLCASYYTNGWLKYYRDHGSIPDTNGFYYGMISDSSNNFPRGQALYTKTSVGPAGKPGQFFSMGQGWDKDGSYADWYAGHEIGHSFGRAHPNAGSDNPATAGRAENCGHSRSDPGFPYGNTVSARAPIGPADRSIEGFDAGDPAFGIARAVYPSAIWNDLMSYCSNQWISDYTYNGMYNFMLAAPSRALASQTIAPAVSGDFLSVAGVINPTIGSADFNLVERVATVTSQPPITPGAYSIRLLDAQNGLLASYAFTPTPSQENSEVLSFSQVVNFVAGTSVVQIVANSDGALLDSMPVSANPPTIGNVALVAAPNPVTGMITLGWVASDPDGDALTFDIYYSRDNGVTFQPAKMGVTDSSATIDSTVLGGSSAALFRVVASDGVNAAEASSAPFVMANKAPEPYILAPGNNTSIHYGQLINFNGMAFDVQDGTVDAAGLTWLDSNGITLGNGPLISSDTLPVGSNLITLVATNSLGQTASTSVTVIVDDNLDLPGPTLTAGPQQVGWHVDEGTTTLQTAQVSIGNAGNDTLGWTASSDQPWLTLDASSGTVDATGDPSLLNLTANPAGLASGRTYSAKLTLTMPASDSNPELVLVIPVTLSIGDVIDNVIPTGFGRIYLPLIQR